MCEPQFTDETVAVKGSNCPLTNIITSSLHFAFLLGILELQYFFCFGLFFWFIKYFSRNNYFRGFCLEIVFFIMVTSIFNHFLHSRVLF